MAVQAQYPSNILLLNRNIVQDSNDYSLQPQPGGGGGFIDQSHMLFNNNYGGGVNPRKISREVAATNNTPTTTTTTINPLNFSLQNQSQNHQLIDVSQLQNHNFHHQQQPSNNNVVSTGLKLSFGEQNYQLQQQQSNTFLSQDLALQLKQHTDELFYFLHSEGEQLKRTLADKRQRHYRALLGAAEEVVSRRMREKELEIEKVAKRNAELEARAAQLNVEAQEWQAKAQAQEAQAVSLQAQLQQAMVGPTNLMSGDNKEESGVWDAESAYIDPISERQVTPLSPSCKMCQTRVATVVLLPCRHLCVCRECDDVIQACPLCFSLRSASVEVYLA